MRNQTKNGILLALSAIALFFLPLIMKHDQDPLYRCSVFTISKGDQVFFGGNDDYITTDNLYWVDPGSDQYYGAIWIGERSNVQQGVNEKGLAYDSNGLPRVDVNPHRERKFVPGDYTNYPIHILRECASVEEVIDWANTHQWHSYMHDQMQFADATGDAVIISAGVDGEVVFTRKPPGDSYLVSTNFNVANPSNGFGYPCWRYERASNMLEDIVNDDLPLTVQNAADVLDAIHTESNTSWTVGSMVADLTKGKLYLYYFHQFDNPVIIDINDELANPRPSGMMSQLFPENVQQEALRRYERIQAQASRFEILGKIWLGLVVACLALFIITNIKEQRRWIFWIEILLILGPIGFLIWLIAGRKSNINKWQMILLEAVGDVIPSIVGYLAAAVWLVAFPREDSLQLLIFYALPLLIGWLLFQSFLLSVGTHTGYFQLLIQKLPHTWVVTNLGLAGVFPVATYLANKSVEIPLPPWIVVAWWSFTVLSALVSILLLSLYHSWAVPRGYRAWSILAVEEGQIISGSWRKLWWWIPLSFLLLIVSVFCYGVLEGAMMQ